MRSPNSQRLDHSSAGQEARPSKIPESLTHFDEAACLGAIAEVMRLRPEGAAELLLLAAKRGRPMVCVSALTAIGELGDLGQVPVLMGELNSGQSFHRIGAARGLAALAVRCPDGEYTAVMEALQKKARGGGVEYRKALEVIRQAIGIDPDLPIPASGGEPGTEGLPIPGCVGELALFERKEAPPVEEETEAEEDEDGSLTRGLKNCLPRPEDWEYD